MAALLRLRQQRANPPAPTTEPFTGSTLLITGASTGLGFATAKGLLALNPARLIITARSKSKGDVAKQELEESFRSSKPKSQIPEIVPMILDMSSADGVKRFVQELKSEIDHLDGVILNAGINMNKYNASSDGWEETMQVNSISTIYLATLLLPILIATADSRPSESRPHLSLVSSGLALQVQPESMQKFADSDHPLHDMSEATNFPPGMMGGNQVYARSKLILEYGMRQLAMLPSVYGANGEPKVIINSLCPGMCKSDLGRQYAELGLMFKIVAWVMHTFLSRTAEMGSNTYISALKQGVKSHGQLWKDDRLYEPPFMTVDPRGQKLGEKIWKELVIYLEKTDPATKIVLEGK